MLILNILILILISSKCSSYIILDRPDIVLNLNIENDYEITLKAFKSSLNDGIIEKEIRDQYNQLEWYSIGYPKLNEIGNEYFVFKPDDFYAEIQLLNDPIKEKLKEEILKIYNINVSKEQIKNLELDQMNCSFEFETENGNLRFNGYVKSFNQPLRLIFKYDRKLKERIEFEEAIKKYKNKTDQLDIEIDCKISLKGYNDKFTIFSRENSKSNEEFYKKEQFLENIKMIESEKRLSDLFDINKKRLEEIEIKMIESEKRSNETNSIIEILKRENNSTRIKLENELEKISEKIDKNEAKMMHINNYFISEILSIIKEKFNNIEKHLVYNNMKELKTLTGHSGSIFSLVVLPNGDLASGSEDGELKIWNINQGIELKRLTGHFGSITSLLVLPNGYLASGSGDGEIKIWNTNEDNELKTLTGHSGSISSLVVLPNGYLASGSGDGEIKIWNISQGKELKTLTKHSNSIQTLVVLPNGDLASGSEDKTIKIWNINQGKKLKTLTGHSDSVIKLVVLNGELVSGSADGDIKIWNINQGKELKTLTGHSDSISSLVVLPNGYLASGSGDGEIKIWNVNEGKELKKLNGHTNSIQTLVVLPNGDLASGSDDKTIKIWS